LAAILISLNRPLLISTLLNDKMRTITFRPDWNMQSKCRNCLVGRWEESENKGFKH
jgi:hypothetical protein